MKVSLRCQNTTTENRSGKPIAWPVSGLSSSKKLFIIALFIVIVCIIFLPASRNFVVSEKSTGKILYHTSIIPGDSFSVKYTHSVNKSPVEDVFEISITSNIILKKIIFQSFGAGIPFELEDEQVLEFKDSGIEINNINRQIDEFLLNVGTIANHTLIIKGHEIALNQLAKPKETVRIEVKKLPICFYLYDWVINEDKKSKINNS